MSDSTCYSITYGGGDWLVEADALGMFRDDVAVTAGGRPVGLLKSDPGGGLPRLIIGSQQARRGLEMNLYHAVRRDADGNLSLCDFCDFTTDKAAGMAPRGNDMASYFSKADGSELAGLQGEGIAGTRHEAMLRHVEKMQRHLGKASIALGKAAAAHPYNSDLRETMGHQTEMAKSCGALRKLAEDGIAEKPWIPDAMHDVDVDETANDTATMLTGKSLPGPRRQRLSKIDAARASDGAPDRHARAAALKVWRYYT
jgi:hypothetical protein